jgi:hypothetical protein
MQRAEHWDAAGEARPAPFWLRAAFWISLAIAAAVVLRRLVALSSPSNAGPADLQQLDRSFQGHAALTLAHILPALLFVLLTPIVLLRRTWWAERLLLATGAVVGITAFAMSRFAVGGWTERSAVLVFNTIFLYSLWEAFRHQGERDQQRQWLLRAVIVLLGIATTRPVMVVFFATSRWTHLREDQFFGIAFWIGFSINLVVAEVWLRRRTAAASNRKHLPK